jgi:hypothetical protein
MSPVKSAQETFPGTYLFVYIFQVGRVVPLIDPLLMAAIFSEGMEADYHYQILFSVVHVNCAVVCSVRCSEKCRLCGCCSPKIISILCTVQIRLPACICTM